MNENIAKKSKADQGLLELMTALLSSYSNEKFGLELNSTPIFPKLKYKGTIQPQRIKAKRAPKISNLSEEETKEIPRPNFVLHILDFEGNFRKFNGTLACDYKFVIELPMLVTGQKLLLQYNDIGFHLRAGALYEISLKWPEAVKSETIEAKFNVPTRELWITFKAKKVSASSSQSQNLPNPQPNKLIHSVNLENPLLNDIV